MEQLNTEDGWWRFLKLCTQAKTIEKLDVLFTVFLTIDERHDLAGRYLIVKELLSEEKPQRQIAQELKVSIAKITRGSNQLKMIDEKTRNFLVNNIK